MTLLSLAVRMRWLYDAETCTKNIQVELQEIASQAVWQKTPISRFLSLRLAPSLSITEINPFKPNLTFQQPPQGRKNLDSRSCIPTR
jgi:hypothetical protein